MNRLKTYDATGIAPNGRLYSGDINALQDAVAALTDLTQNISVASLIVGESGLILSRYGAGEARLSGAFRTDGIFRALSGFLGGSYSTTARNAIVNPPYGLTILNTDTNQYEWNSGTPAAPVWKGIGGGSYTSGLLGSIPAASATNANAMYLATDDNGGTLYISNGATWTKVAPGKTQQMTPLDGSVTAAKIASQPIVNLAADLVVDLTYRFKLVILNTGSGVRTVTLPSDAGAAYGIGDSIDFMQSGANRISFVAAAGAAVQGNPGLKTNGDLTMATAIKTSANTWTLVGNLTP